MKRLSLLCALALASCIAQPVAAQTMTPVPPLSSPAPTAAWVVTAQPTNAHRLAASTSGVAGYFMIFDAKVAPADGPVVPKFCRAVAAGASISLVFMAPAQMKNGIVMVFSTTGCYTKTSSATAFFEASIK